MRNSASPEALPSRGKIKSDIFKDKRILFICRETYSKPLFFLARDLSAAGNKVAAFYIMSTESKYKKCYYNEHTIYEFRERLPEVTLYDVGDICDEYVEGFKKSPHPADMEYLKEIERDYTHYKTLGLQLMSSQENTRHYHYRKYWSYTTDEENNYWLELNYKKIIGILDEFKPDVILDTDNAELQRTVLCEVAYKKGIPCLTLEYSKYGYYKYSSFQNCFGVDPYFKEIYERKLKAPEEELKEGLSYVRQFKESSSIMNREFAGSVTAKYKRDSWIWILRVMRGKWNYFWDMDITAGNRKLKKSCPFLYAPTAPYLKYYWDEMRIKRRFLVKNNVFEDPVEGEDYVYMPLHLIPESSVFVKASFYVDELNLIEQVSKALPVGWKLYVKEHQAMLGERDISFYKKVKEIPGVRLVQINYYQDPKPWIVKAKGIITITGTAAYEAALLGKRSAIFGNVPFGLIDGVRKINSYEELPEIIRSFGELDNERSAAAYIEAVKEAGEEVKIFELMDGAEDIFAGRIEETDEYDGMLMGLLKMFEKGYLKWQVSSKER